MIAFYVGIMTKTEKLTTRCHSQYYCDPTEDREGGVLPQRISSPIKMRQYVDV